MRAALLSTLAGGLLGVLALAAPGRAPADRAAPDVLASQTVTQVARTLDGAAAGQVTVTVELIREGHEVQARATFRSALPGPAVANGTLRLLTPAGAELARSNPRQLATLDAGSTPALVTPRAPGTAACADAQLNVWSGPQAPGPGAARSGPELQPVVFDVQLCPA